MKYKYYKLLTAEEKEEYNYRFKPSEYPNPPFELSTITILYVLLIASMCMFILVKKEFVSFEFDKLYYAVNKFAQIMIYSAVFFMGVWIVGLFYRSYLFHKWKKSINYYERIKNV